MDKQKTIPSRPALGKGLASLLPSAAPSPASTQQPAGGHPANSATPAADSNRDRHPGISMCLIDEVVANDFQPRKTFFDESIEELAQSIRQNGLIQPLIVRKAAKGYQLIAGERRLRAAKLAGLKQVPIVIRRTTDKEALELALIENIQREDLNCFETALAYYQLIQDFNLTQEDLASRMGKDRTTIANHLRLLKLPQSVQTSLRDGLLTYGHGKALAGLEDSSQIEKLAWEVIDKKWSVRELENQIQKIKNLQSGTVEAEDAKETAELDPVQLRLKNLTRDLSAKLATKVQLRGDASRGKIVIEYYSGDDLERVLAQVLK
ncbi:MAG: ParB/RepB/Spo0J family partition protein [Deltaproteobacteria bacterium]|nr:ParB/RepB/Spo0J family partition protein [Deltaproteobacteria bacterium]